MLCRVTLQIVLCLVSVFFACAKSSQLRTGSSSSASKFQTNDSEVQDTKKTPDEDNLDPPGYQKVAPPVPISGNNLADLKSLASPACTASTDHLLTCAVMVVDGDGSAVTPADGLRTGQSYRWTIDDIVATPDAPNGITLNHLLTDEQKAPTVTFSLLNEDTRAVVSKSTVASSSPKVGSYVLSQHTIFVSPPTASTFGGVAGADFLCGYWAARGEKTKNLPGIWKAIISDSRSQAKDRIKIWVSVVNTNGDLSGASQFFGDSHSHAVEYDKDGKVSTYPIVWTGSKNDGTVDGVNHCDNWSKAGSDATMKASIGYANSASSTWLGGGLDVCAGTRGLYCINQ